MVRFPGVTEAAREVARRRLMRQVMPGEVAIMAGSVPMRGDDAGVESPGRGVIVKNLERVFLENAINADALVEFWRGRQYPVETILGVPTHVSDKLVFVSALNDAYQYDGIAIFEIGSVSRMRRSTQELGTLRRRLGQPLPVPFPVSGDAFMEIVLDRLALLGETCALRLESGGDAVSVIGRPTQSDGTWIAVESLGPRGERGESLVRIEEVSCVEIRTAYLETLRELASDGDRSQRGRSA
jgi:hypothetical protein